MCSAKRELFRKTIVSRRSFRQLR